MSNYLVVTSEYLPNREALLIRLDLSNYLIDYYLHRKDYAAGTTVEHDEKLKELLSCLAIHLTIHPSTETHAWTVHTVANDPFSLFATGSAGTLDQNGVTHGFLVGHVLTENIRHTDVNSFHAQFSNDKGKVFKSYVRCDTSDISKMVEHFYGQSEQQPLRLSLSKTSDTAIGLVALPEFDKPWFDSIDLEDLVRQQDPTKKPMRTCTFEFSCDCSPEKLLPFFRALSEAELSELYGADEELIISCPRCGKRFPLPRSAVNTQ